MNSDSMNLFLLRALVEEDDNLEGVGLTKTELYGGKRKMGTSPKNGCQTDGSIFLPLHHCDHGNSAH